jgi:hypothetical protein
LAAVIVARVEVLRRDVDRLLERADSVPDLSLVAIRRGGVDVAVARCQRRRHDPLSFGFVDQKDAEAELRDPRPVVELDGAILRHTKTPTQ